MWEKEGGEEYKRRYRGRKRRCRRRRDERG